MLPIPTDKLGNIEKGFQILEDWAHNVTYLDDDIENERNIILEESRLGKGADDRMFKRFILFYLKVANMQTVYQLVKKILLKHINTKPFAVFIKIGIVQT
jgi:hypothetical protein